MRRCSRVSEQPGDLGFLLRPGSGRGGLPRLGLVVHGSRLGPAERLGSAAGGDGDRASQAGGWSVPGLASDARLGHASLLPRGVSGVSVPR
jgi:hypothetical protein